VRVLAVAASMGSGKTHQIVDLLKALLNGETSNGYTDDLINDLKNRFPDQQDIRILFIGPRITFDDQLQNRLVAFEVRMYSEEGIEKEDPNLMIYQFESLHKLENKRRFDIVIIDEIESVSCHVTEGLNKTYEKENIRMFESLVRHASLTIGLDAFMTKRSIDLIAGILKKEGEFKANQMAIEINTNRDNVKRNYTIHSNRDSIRNEIAHSIQSKTRIAIAVGTLKEGQWIVNTILQQYAGLRYKFYHRDRPEKGHGCEHLLDFKGDLNTIWANLDVVVYTCKLTVGLHENIFGDGQ
jgi:thymidine kinase